MNGKHAVAALAFLAGTVSFAQQANEIQLKIDSSNRTLTVSAQEPVTADPDIAVLHVGFQTPPSDSKSAYATGAKLSNDIVNALKVRRRGACKVDGSAFGRAGVCVESG